jgi:hypothetical protein
MGQSTIDSINAERKYQVVTKGYTKEKDDDNLPHQWGDFLDDYVINVLTAATPEEYRRQLVKVAALAVAAIESFDRTNV